MRELVDEFGGLASLYIRSSFSSDEFGGMASLYIRFSFSSDGFGGKLVLEMHILIKYFMINWDVIAIWNSAGHFAITLELLLNSE